MRRVNLGLELLRYRRPFRWQDRRGCTRIGTARTNAVDRKFLLRLTSLNSRVPAVCQIADKNGALSGKQHILAGIHAPASTCLALQPSKHLAFQEILKGHGSSSVPGCEAFISRLVPHGPAFTYDRAEVTGKPATFPLEEDHRVMGQRVETQ